MGMSKASQPVITLTTDFGTADHFTGVMKGVILRICPSARIVDITHEVRPFDISQGAFLISEAYRWFPPKTVHVVVVDPGVGTQRRAILVEAAGHRFIAPDNGVLAMVYADLPHKVRHLTAEKYFLPSPGRTFHGRDIFAPAAAHLAAGVRPASFGRTIDDHLKTAFYKPQRTSRRQWSGTVLHVDRFGNLITNFRIDEFPGVCSRPFEALIGAARISRFASTFAEGQTGEPLLIAGSSGYFEVAVNQGSAAKLLGCGTGAPVDLTL
jgi:S-adenosylmethionine hydrolase